MFYQLDSIRILPIKSDPTNLDSDEDGFIDIYDPNKLIYNEHYDREKVKDYASTWAKSRNPIYPGDEIFETDCANFVSQCVESGGYPMDENWYIIKKNIDITYIPSKVWSIIVDHFDENDTYVKNGWRMSTSWGKARLNCEYFSGLNEGNVIKVSDYISIDNEFITANNIQVGDLLYFCEGDDAAHATVITELTGDKIKYTAHSYDRDNVELKDFSESYSCIIIIKMEDALPCQ